MMSKHDAKNDETIRLIRCPGCKRSVRYDVKNPNRPFCSERCKIADTAAWATESYKIAGSVTEDADPDARVDPAMPEEFE